MAQGKHLRLVSVFTLAVVTALAADGAKPAVAAANGGAARTALPPVLRDNEPADSSFVLLPAPAAVPATPAPVKTFVAPEPKPSAPVEVAGRGELEPPTLTDPGRPILRHAPGPIYPKEFEQDSGLFCQKQIGHWKEQDALSYLGVPAADRPAFDDRQNVNGRIYAFSDPSNRYRQLELDFDSETGALRTVFVYPWKMTWLDCRRMWSGDVSATDAPKGRKFFSFANRRLDVLVDVNGKVISIGLY